MRGAANPKIKVMPTEGVFAERNHVLELNEKDDDTPAVTYSMNGVGTTLYGHADEWPDGTFVKTKWVIFLFLPLLPVASYRVAPVADAHSCMQKYRLSAVPLHWRQVLMTYLVGISAPAAVVLGLLALQ